MSNVAFFGAADEQVDEWDQLILNEVVWPGIWTISGDGSQRDVDVKKAPGCDLATVVDKGYKNAKFSFTGELWLPIHWAQLQAILPTLHPRKMGGKRKPMSIIYPALSLLGIKSVYVKGISFLQLDKRTQIGSVKLDFIEWEQRPPGVPRAATSGGCGVGVPPADDVDNTNSNNGLAGNEDQLEGITFPGGTAAAGGKIASPLKTSGGCNTPPQEIWNAGTDEEAELDAVIEEIIPPFLSGFYTSDPDD